MMDEQVLLEALRRGEPRALDDFYRAYARTVLAWAIRLGGPGLDAEDVAQDVFAVAFRRLEAFRGDSKLSTWLFGITRFVIQNARRRAAFRRLVAMDVGSEPVCPRPLAEQEVEAQQRRRQVQMALESLKIAQREVLVLMDMEARSAPEVAEMLGIPPGTVYSRLHYARKAFAGALAEVEARSGPATALLASAPGAAPPARQGGT